MTNSEYGLIADACIFYNNSATTWGALWSGSESNSQLSNCTFDSNRAILTDGGAVGHSDLSRIIYHGCFFYNNSATNGGAMSVEDHSLLYITDCIFQENTATEGGGAVSAIDRSFLISIGTTWHKNNAAFGGAVYSEVGNFRGEGNLFTENRAGEGGAIKALFSGHKTASLVNCTLE